MSKYKAYIAAIDHYPNPANNLPSCINDAKAFHQKVTDVYKFTDVRFDYDEKATLQNVEAGLSWLFDGASADDRLVFFFSGHGFQVARGQNLEEVLCLYDQFLFDNVLSQKSQAVPPGVFTLISDSCHSGGMYKVLMTDGHIDVAQTKVLKVPPIVENDKVFLDPKTVSQLRYRPFGARPGPVSTLGKRFGMAVKEFDEAGELQMNGMLLSACLADETASASTPKTGGKSAFTYALLEQLAVLGPNVSNRQLLEGTTKMLRDLGFRQTPVLTEPTHPAGLATASFLLFQGQAALPPSTPDWMTRIIQDVLSNQRKDPAMMQDKSYGQPAAGGDEKFWGVIASLASVAVPAIVDALRKGDYQPQKDFTAVPGGEDKFWRTLLNVVTTAVPAVVQALRKGGYEPQKDFSGGQEKFLGSILRIATGCLPPLMRTIAAQGIQPQKDFGGEEKFWGAIANAISATLPVVINALSKQGGAPAKGFEDVPAGDQKFFGAIASVIGTLGPLVIQALNKSGVDPQKDFQQAGQEKFIGALMSVVGTVAPIVIQALTKSGIEPQKDFGGEEKFWGAFASIVQTALPAVIGALRKGDFEQGKDFAPAMPASGAGDEKFWGTIARVVASAIPTIVGELTKSGAGVSTISPALAPSLAPSGSGMPHDLVANVVSSALPQLQRTY